VHTGSQAKGKSSSASGMIMRCIVDGFPAPLCSSSKRCARLSADRKLLEDALAISVRFTIDGRRALLGTKTAKRDVGRRGRAWGQAKEVEYDDPNHAHVRGWTNMKHLPCAWLYTTRQRQWSGFLQDRKKTHMTHVDDHGARQRARALIEMADSGLTR